MGTIPITSEFETGSEKMMEKKGTTRKIAGQFVAGREKESAECRRLRHS